MRRPRATSGGPENNPITPTEQMFADAAAIYGELLATRDRLAGLPAVTAFDLENAAQAISEVVWFLWSRRPGSDIKLPVGRSALEQFSAAAADRSSDLFVLTVALVASKLAHRRGGNFLNEQVALVREALDALAFDYRTPKRTTLGLFRQLRDDLDDRARYVRAHRPASYAFRSLPEQYRNRHDKREAPDAFFRRVYGHHVRRGLTQSDIRRADPAYYNVLHVWCSRHGRKLSAFVPPTRSGRN